MVAGISGWTWGDSCELQSLWVERTLRRTGLSNPNSFAAAEAEAARRGCRQIVHSPAATFRPEFSMNGPALINWSSGRFSMGYRRSLVP